MTTLLLKRLNPRLFLKTLNERRLHFREIEEVLQNRGIFVEEIADSLVDTWKSSEIKLERKAAIRTIKRALNDPAMQFSILLGLEMDQLAEKGKLSDAVRQIITKDDPLCNIDELVAKAALQRLGSEAIDRFHALDVKKSNNYLKQLDSSGQVNMFADDLVIAILVMAEMDLKNRGKLDTQRRSQENDTGIQQSRKKRRRADHVTTKELKREARKRLEQHGIFIDQIAKAAFEGQKPFSKNLKFRDAKRLTNKLLNGEDSATREIYYAILFLTEIDTQLKAGLFSDALNRRFQEGSNRLFPTRAIADGVAIKGDISRARLGLSRQTGEFVSAFDHLSPLIRDLAYVLVGNVSHMIADQQRRKAESLRRRAQHALTRGKNALTRGMVLPPKRDSEKIQLAK